MLFTGTTVSAVLDLGASVAVGDRRFDPVVSAIYLTEPSHTPNATAADGDVAVDWLRQHGLADLFEPVRRWLAAYWAFDPALTGWCHRVLSEHGDR